MEIDEDLMSDDTLDLTELRSMWEERRAAMRVILQRLDFRGLTRPARDPEERAWLGARGEEIFVEDQTAARAAREYYQRKYTRPSE